MNSWSRQPREGTKPFHAFSHYREVGIERSIEKAFQQHRDICEHRSEKASKVDRCPGSWRRWSVRHSWVQRAASWDAKLEEDAQEKYRKRLLEVRERHAEIARGAIEAPKVPIAAVLKAMAKPDAIEKLVVEAETNPKALRKLLVIVARQAAAIKALTDTERLALGLSTEVVEIGKRQEVDPLADTLAKDPAAVSRVVQALQAAERGARS